MGTVPTSLIDAATELAEKRLRGTLFNQRSHHHEAFSSRFGFLDLRARALWVWHPGDVRGFHRGPFLHRGQVVLHGDAVSLHGRRRQGVEVQRDRLHERRDPARE
jgi:hypothetical protein